MGLGRIFGMGVKFNGERGGNGTTRRGTLAKAAGVLARGGGWLEGSEILFKISVGMDGDFSLDAISGLPLPTIQADRVF